MAKNFPAACKKICCEDILSKISCEVFDGVL
jgi:hypothetical protein